ncbi:MULTISPECIES: aminopeptidase [Micromonospora]|uniref:Aminopeptidase n=1 Tax=Micromonospora sicca TaxID=2202420 RepID=A0A317DQZ8_9ACTN|nr:MULTISPECIES: aminopeptidase [unclassified Micromonospora]MBM0226703.1 aminopeptidase [Micromonospora sp. ATA51]PWR17151.1 aminopeptidase [Micromonospora sp. 4G51]
MRLPLGLLLASVVSGVLSVAAALLVMPGASLQYGLVMLLALLGYVVAASRGVRRVRWAVILGIGLLAVVAATRLSWYQEQIGDGSLLTYGRVGETAMLARWREMIDRERLAAAGLLLGVLCLTAGVLALPARGRRRGVATSLLALLLLAWFGLSFARGFGRYPLLELLGTVWPALLGTLAAMGALALSGWRADRRWLLPVGSFLLALAAAHAYSDLAATWSGWWMIANPRDDAFLEVGVRVSTSAENFPQVSKAVEAALALAGPGLVAVGALRSSREADPGQAEAPQRR